MITRRQLIAAGAATAALGALPVRAQSPQPLRVIIGFAPGGSADVIARHFGAHAKMDGVSAVIVESRPGAGGRIAVEAVRNSNDGRTVLVTPGSILSIYPHVYDKLPYDSVKDFDPVTPLAFVPFSLSVGPMVPERVKTLKDFAQWCKENPGDASYGSPGGGTTPHFVGAMFGQTTGINYQHVPYRGGAPALQDVMAGQIASSVNVVSEAMQLARAGKVRVLAVTSAQRLAQLPDVPTVAEAGFADLQSDEWFGLFAPAGTAPERIEALNAAARRAFATPTVQAAMAEMAFTIEPTTPAAFGERLRSDIARWGPVVKQTGFKAEA